MLKDGWPHNEKIRRNPYCRISSFVYLNCYSWRVGVVGEMKAKLLTGKIVELEKDCDCQHHDGPHWLYMNEWWRYELNQQPDSTLDTINQLGGKTNDISIAHMLNVQLNQIANEMIERLNEKEYWMKFYGIEELLPE